MTENQDTKIEEKIVQEQIAQPSSTQSSPSEEDPNQINWKKFKEARKKEREEAEAMSKRAAEKEAEANALKLAMDAILNKQSSQSQPHNTGFDEDESEDSRIEKKVQAALQAAEKRRIQEQQRIEQETFPQRLNQNHKDFNEVCTTENLDYLEYHYPEVAAAFKNVPDSYDKWANVYKAVKRFVPNIDSRKEAAKAEKNFNKPQSISSPGLTTSGHAVPSTILTEERKAANWARMQAARKGLS